MRWCSWLSTMGECKLRFSWENDIRYYRIGFHSFQRDLSLTESPLQHTESIHQEICRDKSVWKNTWLTIQRLEMVKRLNMGYEDLTVHQAEISRFWEDKVDLAVLDLVLLLALGWWAVTSRGAGETAATRRGWKEATAKRHDETTVCETARKGQLELETTMEWAESGEEQQSGRGPDTGSQWHTNVEEERLQHYLDNWDRKFFSRALRYHC